MDGLGAPEIIEAALGTLEAIARQVTQGQNTKPEGSRAASDEQFSDFEFSDPSDYDPEIVDLTDQTNRRFTSLEQKIEELTLENQFLEKGAAEQDAEQNVIAFEAAVNQLDEEIFGRGGFDNVSSQESGNRMALAKSVSRLGHGYSAKGETIPSIEELVEEAFAATFKDQIGKQALQTAASKSRQHRGQSMAAPTSDSASELTSTEAAVQAAADWFKENERR